MPNLPVQDYDGWERSESGSIQLTAQSEYDKYMAGYNARQKEKLEKEALQKDVSQLKSEMSEIKSLLLTLVQNREKHYDD